MTWLILAGVLAVLLIILGCCRVAGEADDRIREIRVDRLMTTPAPTPPPEPAAIGWARYPVPLDDELQRYTIGVCAEYGVDPALVFAVIHVETGGTYDPALIGDSGNSYGLMQIWAECHLDRMDKLGVTDLTDPRESILVGVDILAELIGYGHGVAWALSFYHGNGGAEDPYAREVMTLAEAFTESTQIQTYGKEKQ